MSESNASAHTPQLQHFPVALFAMIMGLGGLTIAWRKAEELLALPFSVSPWLLGLSTGLLVLLAALYATKVLRYRPAAASEWSHPVKMNFVPTISIALILLSIAWLPVSTLYSKLLWLLGSGLHLALTLYVMTQWMHHSKLEITHINPAWFIPVVGNILVPIAGMAHAPAQVSWFFFSIGLIFWPPLLTIILYRVIFHGSLPERLMPTLFILIAPPAAGYLAYVSLTGAADPIAHVLYHTGLFFTLLLFAQGGWFLRLKFNLSWWAYSFPLAAITIATLDMFQQTGITAFIRLASILLGVTTVVIAGLFARTLLAATRREICVAD